MSTHDSEPSGCLGALGDMLGELMLGLAGLAVLVGLGVAYAASPRWTVGTCLAAVAAALAGLAFWQRSWSWPLRFIAVVVGLSLAAVLTWLLNSGFDFPYD